MSEIWGRLSWVQLARETAVKCHLGLRSPWVLVGLEDLLPRSLTGPLLTAHSYSPQGLLQRTAHKMAAGLPRSLSSRRKRATGRNLPGNLSRDKCTWGLESSCKKRCYPQTTMMGLAHAKGPSTQRKTPEEPQLWRPQPRQQTVRVEALATSQPQPQRGFDPMRDREWEPPRWARPTLSDIRDNGRSMVVTITWGWSVTE